MSKTNTSTETNTQPEVTFEEALATRVEAYLNADTGMKAKMRNAAKAAVMAAIEAVPTGKATMEDVTKAAALVTALDGAVASRKSAAGPDLNQLASDLAATLEAAAFQLRVGIMVGESRVAANQPGTADEAQVAKLATIKTRSQRGENGIVASWIIEHATDEPLTIAQVRALGDKDGYRPSTGAIGAALDRGVEGIEEGVNAEGTRTLFAV